MHWKITYNSIKIIVWEGQNVNKINITKTEKELNYKGIVPSVYEMKCLQALYFSTLTNMQIKLSFGNDTLL